MKLSLSLSDGARLGELGLDYVVSSGLLSNRNTELELQEVSSVESYV